MQRPYLVIVCSALLVLVSKFDRAIRQTNRGCVSTQGLKRERSWRKAPWRTKTGLDWIGLDYDGFV